jgi:hypothetical protein
MREILDFIEAPFTVIGIAFTIAAWRFVRKPQVDSTAGWLWFIVIVWNLASQTEAFVKKFPWISKDLTEAFGNEEADDNEVT